MADSTTQRKEYAAKLLLTSIFLGLFAVFTGWMLLYGPGFDLAQISVFDFVLLALATYRMGHLISYDRVTEPLRAFFTRTVPDPTGAGDSIEPRGEGVRQVLGQLICCPICSGTWAAAALVYAQYLWPGPARAFILILAAIGAAEILNAFGEMASWGGQYARTLSGAANLTRTQPAKPAASSGHAAAEKFSPTESAENRHSEAQKPAVHS